MHNAKFFEFGFGIILGELGANAARIFQKFAVSELDVFVDLGSPVFHRHGDLSLGAVFGEFEVGVDDAPEGIELVFFEIILGGADIAFEYFAIGCVLVAE